ncbi:hypothetical protein [Nocardioides sp.]|uniref:zinc ribbon-containing protein n=1 Tax=Nocardioides sp. TaxID=35761 RepID=UPI0034DF64F9
MADPVPAGSDVSAGTYRCTQCGYELDVSSTQHLPPCSSCANGSWQTVSGGDSVEDPYPRPLNRGLSDQAATARRRPRGGRGRNIEVRAA